MPAVAVHAFVESGAMSGAIVFWTRAGNQASRRRADDRRFGRSINSLNLSLAARLCVGHIGLNGDVAEWLKAAVC